MFGLHAWLLTTSALNRDVRITWNIQCFKKVDFLKHCFYFFGSLPQKRFSKYHLLVHYKLQRVKHSFLLYLCCQKVLYVTSPYCRTPQNFQIPYFQPVIQMVTMRDYRTAVGVPRALEPNIFKLICREIFSYLILEHLETRNKQSGRRLTAYNTVALQES